MENKTKLKVIKPDLSKYNTVRSSSKAINVHIAEELKKIRIESCIHLQAMSCYYHMTEDSTPNLSKQKDEE